MATPNNSIKEALKPAINTQAGYSVADLLSRVIGKSFKIENRGVIKLVVGLVLPFVIKKWFRSWKLPDEFIGGMYITGFNGVATVIQNMTNKEKKNVTVNGLLSQMLGMPQMDLAGYSLGNDDLNYVQLPNGLVLAQLKNGTYLDEQGNVYTEAQLQQMVTGQGMMVSGFGADDEGDYDEGDYDEGDYDEGLSTEDPREFELMMGQLDKVNSLLGDEDEDLGTRQGTILNGSREISLC